jgi:hypothetical protein
MSPIATYQQNIHVHYLSITSVISDRELSDGVQDALSQKGSADRCVLRRFSRTSPPKNSVHDVFLFDVSCLIIVRKSGHEPMSALYMISLIHFIHIHHHSRAAASCVAQPSGCLRNVVKTYLVYTRIATAGLQTSQAIRAFCSFAFRTRLAPENGYAPSPSG